jgi:hypothetical protein
VRNLEKLQTFYRGCFFLYSLVKVAMQPHILALWHFSLLPQQILAKHLSFPAWMNTTSLPSASLQSCRICSEHVRNMEGRYYQSFCYPWSSTQDNVSDILYVRIPSNPDDHSSGLGISQQITVSIWSTMSLRPNRLHVKYCYYNTV